MTLKVTIYISFTFIILMLVIWIGLSKRRDLPFQEVVPLDQRIAVVNAGKWYNSDMSVALLENGKNQQIKKFNANGICIFDNLNNGTPYTIKVKRTDIKGILLYRQMSETVAPRPGGTDYVVLVGASIGKRWDFPGLVSREKLGKNTILGFRELYDFDKSKEIETLSTIPDIVKGVIIKECAAYFPRDLEKSKLKIESWVEKLQQAGIRPALATVVPITKELDEKAPGKFESILKYNDFIRQYAQKKRLEVLDLEKVLSVSPINRHLKDEYAQYDGYHLVQSAYDRQLDKMALSVLANM
jgi:hypothetical protein